MTPSALTAYLHEHIPLSTTMGVRAVSTAMDEVVLEAPLGPNINHRGTLFGGSATALAILAGWSLVHLRLAAAGEPARLVIQREAMTFEAPVTGDVAAHARLAPETDWERAIEMLRRRGRARVEARCELIFSGNSAGRMEAAFVALRQGPDG